ncbi:MAG: thermonuclease family protein [Maritimibacter sp.]|uniref:thermonuclease family protein n=1 Tax=Maritimibacter sp. TaxID=2003363 RepID=UPI001DB8E578|nr:thermonuclease family protein [Maritimibacter sp.]MBL6426700.1 thermonuclease family protein [Maritimibacter sp.]
MLTRVLRLLFSSSSESKTTKQYHRTEEFVRFDPNRSTRPARPRPVPRTTTPAKHPPVVDRNLETTITGKCYVIDGDTIQIGKVRLRLAGIDAPELDHPWGQKAKWELVRLCKGAVITAELEQDISYDRLVATCYLPDGRDLSAEMVRLGFALDWPKFSKGKYSHLEPEGARKKHWKAAARQRGHMHVFHK